MALQLHMPVRYMLARMTSRELGEWMAYFMLEEAEQTAHKGKSEIAQLKGQFNG